ncbi:MAG: vitamin K epoxide reductase family protein [Polaribacter sp.]|uniref:vitamin K epoxide reductase family protein n=1 Tax=Polaribacter sp. TaxID=1920175 RepID=UPI00326547BF
MKDTLFLLVQNLLLKNRISFDKKELSFQIQSHPSYPSLHAITGVLDHFNLENVAAEVPINVETLLQLPDCFIAQINTVNGTDLVLIEREKLDYIIYNSSSEKEKVTESGFLEKFTGIILVVEKNEDQKSKLFEANQINKVFYFSTIVLLGVVFVLSKPTIISSIYFLLALIGTVISISVFNQELGVQNTIGNAFCSSSNEKKDCDAVLSSKGATIFKNYKLSDLSLIYFLGLAISTFLFSIGNISLEIVYIISLLALPITIYSIYYQYKIVKKWCFLCLSIVGILLLQGSIFFFTKKTNIVFLFDKLIITSFSFSLIFTIWSYIKPKYIELLDGKKIKIDAVKFKRNFNLFSTLLHQSQKIETKIVGASEIVFGNETSKLSIVVITNPFCGHCKPVHQIIEDILKKYNKEVKITIRFNINIDDRESDVVKITSRLLDIYNIKGKEDCLAAMGEIYGGLSPKNWLDKRKETDTAQTYISVLEKEKEWSKENAINFTPEILINGKSFPKEYDRSDLIYFIEDLYEECCSTEDINNIGKIKEAQTA